MPRHKSAIVGGDIQAHTCVKFWCFAAEAGSLPRTSDEREKPVGVRESGSVQAEPRPGKCCSCESPWSSATSSWQLGRSVCGESRALRKFQHLDRAELCTIFAKNIYIYINIRGKSGSARVWNWKGERLTFILEKPFASAGESIRRGWQLFEVTIFQVEHWNPLPLERQTFRLVTGTLPSFKQWSAAKIITVASTTT